MNKLEVQILEHYMGHCFEDPQMEEEYDEIMVRAAAIMEQYEDADKDMDDKVVDDIFWELLGGPGECSKEESDTYDGILF